MPFWRKYCYFSGFLQIIVWMLYLNLTQIIGYNDLSSKQIPRTWLIIIIRSSQCSQKNRFISVLWWNNHMTICGFTLRTIGVFIRQEVVWSCHIFLYYSCQELVVHITFSTKFVLFILLSKSSVLWYIPVISQNWCIPNISISRYQCNGVSWG